MNDAEPEPLRTENPEQRQLFLHRHLPELQQLEQLITQARSEYPQQSQLRRLAYINCRSQILPIYALTLGSFDPQAPVVAFVGGIHGVERIGTRVLLAFLSSLLNRLSWDQSLHQQLRQIRLLFLPLINPAGMALKLRSNAERVDLMRNAPVNATHKATWLIGGQRFSPRLPWYRGHSDSPMQTEARALCDCIRQHLFDSPFSLVLDCHSGFGLRDRIWFPLAGSRNPIHHSPEIAALVHLFERSYPHHNYIVEPQHHSYLTHGDLWDYLYQQALQQPERVFLPLTLEMGSWNWVRKNPLQLASFMGLFNPLVPHREKRTFRRHLLLLEFLLRSCQSWQHWLPRSDQERQRFDINARQRWYG